MSHQAAPLRGALSPVAELKGKLVVGVVTGPVTGSGYTGPR